MTVDQVRNLLRGDPGTDITIQLERDVHSSSTTVSSMTSTSRTSSSNRNNRDSTATVTLSSTDPLGAVGPKTSKLTRSNDNNKDKSMVTVNMKRQQVKISDVSLATYLGNYIHVYCYFCIPLNLNLTDPLYLYT